MKRSLMTIIPASSAILAILLSGCSIIPNPGESPKRFTLEAVAGTSEKNFSKQKIMVDMPVIYPPIDSQRVGVVPAANQIDYYADCEWGDRLGVLIQDSLTYSLQNNRIFTVVSRTNEGVVSDLLLKTNVRKFFVVQHPQPTATVQYYVQLIQLSDRQVLAQTTLETSIPLHEEKLEEISSKLNQANLETTTKILNWLREAVHR
ncbi:ABC-type transport auxiliary lipoprotein family protein [Candidatus Paracaedibacter symbiosus]|uniref:ABC-type transport auxiliary lipoprotein family protein n=1 Tax=Candidatus Paracaedibacter symbiosus TaxID=244582 RepID=UPI0005093D6E|nr:ABC-type transport auxiliary lipoprotein family protein [Candidatus Paracaedibacter symbiosus]